MSRRSVLAFAPYLAASAFHLWALIVPSAGLAPSSKWLLMPALLFAILVMCFRRVGTSVMLVVIAVALSWAGDVLLGMPGDIGFLIGLGAFFLAHVTYLVVFLTRLRARRVLWPIAVFAVWWIALIVILGPSLGALLVPVGLYGLVLAASTTAALGCNAWIGTGGVLFLASDTILAFKLFYPGFSMWQIDVVIMVLYLGAQGLIVFGATRSREPARQLVVAA
jgi:uncharacterized membrane protein YhhN